VRRAKLREAGLLWLHDKVARYCATHKKEFMVDVRHNKCAHEGCQKLPSFGHAHDGRALFCKAHKEPSMVNVVDRRCQVVSCEKRATHGLLSDKVCVCSCMCAHLIIELFTSLTACPPALHTHHRFLATAHDTPLTERA
jgi:EsV-1-7 cysteine-rich motif